VFLCEMSELPPMKCSLNLERETHAPEGEPVAKFGRQPRGLALAGAVADGKNPDIEFFKRPKCRIELRFR
jgi:hypothetical protein